MDSSKMKIVYQINERSGKSYWNRVGVGFVNSDGSINVKLDSVPISGEIHVRDYVPREDTTGAPAGVAHTSSRNPSAVAEL